MRNVNSFSVKPEAIKEFSVESDRVHVRLASGHYISWPNKSGLTVVGEKVLTGIQADASDCETVEGVTLRDKNGAEFTGLTQCPLCDSYHKSNYPCDCVGKVDQREKTLESVKRD